MCNPKDELRAFFAGQRMEVRLCRTINCGLHAVDGDVFCVKCREEIDAAREAARRRFVIFATRRRPRLSKE
jgi:hypothetical protein